MATERCQLCGALLGGDHRRAYRLSVTSTLGGRNVDLTLCRADLDVIWAGFELTYAAALADRQADAAAIKAKAEAARPSPAAA